MHTTDTGFTVIGRDEIGFLIFKDNSSGKTFNTRQTLEDFGVDNLLDEEMDAYENGEWDR